jgi:hypothetical protein
MKQKTKAYQEGLLPAVVPDVSSCRGSNHCPFQTSTVTKTGSIFGTSSAIGE